MSLIEKLLLWSKGLPDWQSDALRRIYEGVVTEKDISEIFAMLKEEHGLHGNDPPKPVRLTEQREEPTAPQVSSLRLTSISNLQNVNRIRQGASISFVPDGLSVIYGDNGTGKSGYGRVFRRACRARGASKEPILPNLMADALPGDVKASASFQFQGDDGPHEPIAWTDDERIEPLMAIAVFDKDSVRAHISEKHKVDFQPYGADLLTELSAVCDKLKSLVYGEIETLPTLPSTLTELEVNSAGAMILARLNKDSTEEDIKAEAKLSDAETLRLGKLAVVITQRRNEDPVKVVAAHRAKAKRCEALRSAIQAVSNSLSTVAQKEIAELVQQLRAAEEAAKATSTKGFSKEPLSGVGSDAWRDMYSAAQSYAEKEAYKDREYSSTFSEKCALCQQDLDATAADRMRRFEEFMNDTTTKRESVLRESLAAKIDGFKILSLEFFENYSDIIDELVAESPNVGETFTRLKNVVFPRRSAFLKTAETGIIEEPHDLPDAAGLITFISTRIDDLNERADAIASQQLTAAQIAEEADYVGLESRSKVSQNIGAVVSFVEGLRIKAKLDECARALNTARITKKQGELLEETLTQELHNALREELTRLGVTSVRPEFTQYQEKGEVRHSITLEGMPQAVDPTKVMSEGEGLVVAIAAFLAELRLEGKTQIIVFDDPVSSLDQHWRARVARRLVEFAHERQIIIFTHDVVFVCELEFWAQQLRYEQRLSYQAMQTVRSDTGVIADIEEMPIEMIGSFKRVISKLNRRVGLAQAIKRDHSENSAMYIAFAASTYSLLRSAWERAVEHILFNDVVRRFRFSVQTQQLRPFEISAGIISEIERAMAKASKYTEAHHSGVPGSMPLPEEIRDDILILDAFFQEYRKPQESSPEAAPAPAGRSSSEVPARPRARRRDI